MKRTFGRRRADSERVSEWMRGRERTIERKEKSQDKSSKINIHRRTKFQTVVCVEQREKRSKACKRWKKERMKKTHWLIRGSWAKVSARARARELGHGYQNNTWTEKKDNNTKSIKESNQIYTDQDDRLFGLSAIRLDVRPTWSACSKENVCVWCLCSVSLTQQQHHHHHHSPANANNAKYLEMHAEKAQSITEHTFSAVAVVRTMKEACVAYAFLLYSCHQRQKQNLAHLDSLTRLYEVRSITLPLCWG